MRVLYFLPCAALSGYMTMKIVIALDSYKENLPATEVAQTIEKGLREIFPGTQYVSVPVTDSGEGAVEAITAATQGSEHSAQVTGSLGGKVNACWDASGDSKTAFIGMTAASGLTLVPPEECNLLVTTSHGTEELILQALDSDAQSIIIGIGDSAANDGSTGMVQALGVKLCGTNETEIGYDGGNLISLNSIDISGLDSRLKTCSIRVAYDVTNSLIDDSGASRIFGLQKGATEERILELDRNLSHYVDIIEKSLRVDVKDTPGSGAADEMGAALVAFLGTELCSGIEIVTQTFNLEEYIHDCTLVVTGEGRIDSQNIHGKVPVGVANATKKYREPVIDIDGNLARDMEVVHQYGIDAVFNVLTSISALEEAFHGAFDDIYRVSRNVAATLAIGMRNAG